MTPYAGFSYNKNQRAKRSARKDEGGASLKDYDAANDKHDRLIAIREERARRREANGVRRLESSTD